MPDQSLQGILSRHEITANITYDQFVINRLLSNSIEGYQKPAQTTGIKTWRIAAGS